MLFAMLFLKYSYICGNSPVILKKMNRFLYTILIALLSSFAVGQTRNALKKTFDAGDFVKAKPMAQKLLKASPKNITNSSIFVAVYVTSFSSAQFSHIKNKSSS